MKLYKFFKIKLFGRELVVNHTHVQMSFKRVLNGRDEVVNEEYT